jgi:hypothetical protein
MTKILVAAIAPYAGRIEANQLKAGVCVVTNVKIRARSALILLLKTLTNDNVPKKRAKINRNGKTKDTKGLC